MSQSTGNVPQISTDIESGKEHGSKRSESISPGPPIVTQMGKRPSISKSSSNTNEHPPKNEKMLRRRLTLKTLANSVIGMGAIRRMTGTSLTGLQIVQPAKPVITMENTYKMEPDEGKAIKSSKIKDVVYKTLEDTLKNEKYNFDRCSKLARHLTSIIKSHLKDLNLPRYKYVCHLIIGECTGQGLQVASRCVWAPSTDNFEYVTYSNGVIFAVASVYGIYYE